MSRSKWKFQFISYKLLKYILANSDSNNLLIRNKSNCVYPLLYKKQISIYNGKVFKNMFFNEDFKDFKLGCFVNTRIPVKHKKNKTKVKKK